METKSWALILRLSFTREISLMYDIGSGSEGPLCLKWLHTACIYRAGTAIECRSNRGGRDGGVQSCSGGAATEPTAQGSSERLPSVATRRKSSSGSPSNSVVQTNFLIQVRAVKVKSSFLPSWSLRLKTICWHAAVSALVPADPH